MANLHLESIVSIEGMDAFKIIVTNGETSSSRYYDVGTGLLVRVESETKAQGQSITSVTDYLDYTSVEGAGIMVPFTQKVTVGPQVISMTTATIQINEDVEDADFE